MRSLYHRGKDTITRKVGFEEIGCDDVERRNEVVLVLVLPICNERKTRRHRQYLKPIHALLWNVVPRRHCHHVLLNTLLDRV